MNWQRHLKGKLKINERLAKHTTLKIGGTVQFWIEPKDLSDLKNLVILAHKKKVPLRIIGTGSNILVDDRGIKGIVMKLNSSYFKRISVNPEKYRIKTGGVKANHEIIAAGAGLSLSRLLRRAQENGLSGFELLAGIPGTVGGALIMNAGSIGDSVLEIIVMDMRGRVKILKKRDVKFGYRNSNLVRYIILNAYFKLIKKDKRAIKGRIEEYLNYRRKTQDLSWPSAGCFFKNPFFDKSRIHSKPTRASANSKSALRLFSLRFAKDFPRTPRRSRSAGMMVSEAEPSAAYFIERCGLKGSFIGDAAVSSKHANFIINKGKASFVDILRLKEHITRCVKKRFNLELEPEVKIWKQI